jgi:hypothetical protein
MWYLYLEGVTPSHAEAWLTPSRSAGFHAGGIKPTTYFIILMGFSPASVGLEGLTLHDFYLGQLHGIGLLFEFSFWLILNVR